MQIVPATGRRLARRARHHALHDVDADQSATSTSGSARCTSSGSSQQFGGTYYALASYNAGESRVVRWKAERPGIDEDEFIDDIPFPETQNYVKRILGTAEDYRRLYGKGGGRPISWPARQPLVAICRGIQRQGDRRHLVEDRCQEGAGEEACDQEEVAAETLSRFRARVTSAS